MRGPCVTEIQKIKTSGQCEIVRVVVGLGLARGLVSKNQHVMLRPYIMLGKKEQILGNVILHSIRE